MNHTQLDPSHHLLPLGIFASYFAIIAALFTFVLAVVTPHTPSPSSPLPRRKRYERLFKILTVFSLAHTWFRECSVHSCLAHYLTCFEDMLGYMRWSYLNFHQPSSPTISASSVASWLAETSLFTEAWSIVLQPGYPYWISDHITRFTCCWWTLFVWSSVDPPTETFKEAGSKKDKARRKGWKAKEACGVMLLGQLVAISVAINLWFLGCVRRGLPQCEEHRRVPVWVWGSLLGSSCCVAIMPLTVNEPSFLPIVSRIVQFCSDAQN